MCYPCPGGQLPHDGRAGGKEKQKYSVRQGNKLRSMTKTQDEIRITFPEHDLADSLEAHTEEDPTRAFPNLM